VFIAAIPLGLFDGTFHVPNLLGNNFTEWKENLLLTLGCLELDLASRMDKPSVPPESSSPQEIAKHDPWERSNCFSLMYIQSHIAKGIKGSIPAWSKAKESMKAVKVQFVSSDKALASTLMKRLSSKTFESSKNVCEHIMRMRDIAVQLKSLEVEIYESFFVHLILNSLPSQYGPFKISYNTYKDKWSANELLTMCVQEKERLKHEKLESVQLVNCAKGKTKKGKFAQNNKKENKVPIKHNSNNETCIFCKNKGHMKKYCLKYLKWLEKKGKLIYLVCHESFFRWDSLQYMVDWFWFYNPYGEYIARFSQNKEADKQWATSLLGE